MEEENKEKDLMERLKEQVEKSINKIIEAGIQVGNTDLLYKLVDIHKDIENEEYWKKGEDEMRYRPYGNYGRDEYGMDGYDRNYGGRRMDSQGRYMERGRDERYRGDDMIDEMKEHYGAYMERGGSYGGAETDKAFDYMLQSAEDFFTHLMEESDSPEQMEKVKRLAKRISEKRM